MAIADATSALQESNVLLKKISETLLNRDRAEVAGSLDAAEDVREDKKHDKKMLAALLGLGKGGKGGKDGKKLGGMFDGLKAILAVGVGAMLPKFWAMLKKSQNQGSV